MRRVLVLMICAAVILSACQAVAAKKVAEPLSKKAAIELAYSGLEEVQQKQLLTPLQVDVTEFRATGKHTLWNPDKMVNIQGVDTYRVEFKTTMDGLLGPTTVYIERSTHKILGLDLRY